MINKNKFPLVSICIPFYNGIPYIEDAIKSVLNQSFTDWELVLTDDQSIDESFKLISSYSDPRIRYILNPKRLGVEGNWNKCVSEAHGVYCKLLCHDDILHPDCLARQVNVFKTKGNESVSLVASARRIISSNGKVLLTRRWKLNDMKIDGISAIKQNLRSGTNLIGEPCAVMFRMSDCKDGLFSIKHPYVIDLDFWIRLLKKGDCFYISDPLSDFRVSPQSWSVSLKNQQSKQYIALLNENEYVSFIDVCIGSFNARMLEFFRRIVYWWICK